MIFSQLEGVKSQDVRKPKTSSLEVLLKLGEKILKEQELKEFPNDYLKARNNYELRAGRISYDSGDIESFILTHADKIYTEQQWKRLGVFTGALVSALTQKEKQATINVDLGNKTFHYLFAWTRKANNIIVKNLTGNYSFWCAGSDQGRVGNIMGMNITGKGTFSWAGAYQGSVESITGINITGDYAFYYVGYYRGNAGFLKYSEVTGIDSFGSANIHQKVLLTPQQARGYLEIVNTYKSNDEIRKMVEQLNHAGGEE